LEPVPGLVVARLVQPVGAGQVDHDPARGRLEPRGALVVEADEDDVGAALQGRLVRDEVRDPLAAVPVQAGIELGGAPAGEAVRADGVQVELGMREHAVERLLPRIAGGTDDGCIRHTLIMQIVRVLCNYYRRTARPVTSTILIRNETLGRPSPLGRSPERPRPANRAASTESARSDSAPSSSSYRPWTITLRQL